MKFYVWFKASIVIIVLLFISQLSLAATVRVTWNKNNDSDLDGYKIYYGTASGQYQKCLDNGLFTSADISSLTEGSTFYFSVTAYDVYGNESVHSQEVSITVPVSGTGTTGGGNGTVPGSGTTGSGSSISTPSGNVSNTGSVGTNGGSDVVNIGGIVPPAVDIIIDIIGDVEELINLNGVNPAGQYSFVPMISSSPVVVDNELDISEPGVYLYNVYDAYGALAFKLRVSVTSHLSTTGLYEPGTPLNLQALSSGIAVQLRSDASTKEVTIGIGDSAPYPASSVSYQNGKGIEFDLLPYGLTLAQPATISVKFDKKDPTVQIYDENEKVWNNVPDVTVANGLVSFSTQVLGKVRIYSETTDNTDASLASSGSGGGGGGCFISSAAL